MQIDIPADEKVMHLVVDKLEMPTVQMNQLLVAFAKAAVEAGLEVAIMADSDEDSEEILAVAW